MKRIIGLLTLFAALTTINAQEWSIGTIEGTSFYGPAVLKVLKEAGIEAKVKSYPTLPALVQGLASGSLDGAFFLAQPIIASIPGATMIPVRIDQTDFCALTTDPAIKIANPGELRKYTVGIVKDQTAHAAVTRGMTPTVAVNDLEQFKLLAAGSVQTIIAVKDMIPSMCKAAGIAQYYVQNPPLLQTPTFLALSAARSAKAGQIGTVLRKWVENGQWEDEKAKLAAPRH